MKNTFLRTFLVCSLILVAIPAALFIQQYVAHLPGNPWGISKEGIILTTYFAPIRYIFNLFNVTTHSLTKYIVIAFIFYTSCSLLIAITISKLHFKGQTSERGKPSIYQWFIPVFFIGLGIVSWAADEYLQARPTIAWSGKIQDPYKTILGMLCIILGIIYSYLILTNHPLLKKIGGFKKDDNDIDRRIEDSN